MEAAIERGDALILVDVQNDFLPGGHLAVAHGDEIIPVLNQYIKLFKQHRLAILASRDWHPADHRSFITQGGIWPVHCVQNTPGAAFSADLALPKTVHLINKAQKNDQDYSAFANTSLHKQLGTLGVTRIFVGGLATEYCVLNTVLDAIRLGYQVFVLEDAIRAIKVKPEDEINAKLEMQQMGAALINIANIKTR